MGRFSLLRRNDRTTQPGSQPLDSCGGLRGTYNLEPLGSFLPEGSLGVPRHQPPHALQAEPEPSGRQSAAGVGGSCLRHLPASGPFLLPGEGTWGRAKETPMLPLPDTGTELSAPGEGAGEGGEREFMNYDLWCEGRLISLVEMNRMEGLGRVRNKR